MHLYQAVAQITNNTIFGNTLTETRAPSGNAVANYGAGVYVGALFPQFQNPQVVLTNNLILGNTINASGLGVNAQSDAELVRVPIPPLTEERRKEFVRLVKHKGEEHKIAIRNERRDAKEMVEEAVKEGEVTEDEGKKALEKVQAEVDNGIKKVDEIIANKEKDLMQV